MSCEYYFCVVNVSDIDDILSSCTSFFTAFFIQGYTHKEKKIVDVLIMVPNKLSIT